MRKFIKTSSPHKYEFLRDYKGQISYGRVGGFMCLVASFTITLIGLFYSNNDKMLSYCSTMALQFLGAAVALYIPTKTSETLSKKWAPTISETLSSTASAILAPTIIPEETPIEPTGSEKALDD